LGPDRAIRLPRSSAGSSRTRPSSGAKALPLAQLDGSNKQKLLGGPVSLARFLARRGRLQGVNHRGQPTSDRKLDLVLRASAVEQFETLSFFCQVNVSAGRGFGAEFLGHKIHQDTTAAAATEKWAPATDVGIFEMQWNAALLLAAQQLEVVSQSSKGSFPFHGDLVLASKIVDYSSLYAVALV